MKYYTYTDFGPEWSYYDLEDLERPGIELAEDPAEFDTVLEALCAVDDFAGLSSAGLTSLADGPCNVCLQEFQIAECEE